MSEPSAAARPSLWGEPPPRPCPTLHRLLRLAGARPTDKVCVTGPQGLAVLLSLCRMGYAEACCVRPEACACGDGACDVLLVTGPMGREALASALAHALPRLKDGGVLAAHESCLDDDDLILAALAASGRSAGWRVHDMAGSCLVALEVSRAGRPELRRAA